MTGNILLQAGHCNDPDWFGAIENGVAVDVKNGVGSSNPPVPPQSLQDSSCLAASSPIR